jgi:hypothetical protein
MNLIDVSIQEEDYVVIQERADKDGCSMDRALHSMLNDVVGKKRPSLTNRIFGKNNPCPHPESMRIYTAFGVHCDVCKEPL